MFATRPFFAFTRTDEEISMIVQERSLSYLQTLPNIAISPMKWRAFTFSNNQQGIFCIPEFSKTKQISLIQVPRNSPLCSQTAPAFKHCKYPNYFDAILLFSKKQQLVIPVGNSLRTKTRICQW
uniref:Uncharacterized protein n=1 Tax=Spongospora subterranea TaxID=70186 RepID=A0A0H5RES8_9EUKA|eukprot:CRZ12037.1 hypothetical protein [Spongospora subterranea]